MRRIGFAVLLTFSFFVAPLAAVAQQQTKVPRIGFLRAGPPPRDFVEGFGQGLRELGYVEGQNITIEYRFTDGTTTQLANWVPSFCSGTLRLSWHLVRKRFSPRRP